MANSNYNLICAGNGSEGCIWVTCATDKLPDPGIEGKIYVCKNNGKWYCWVNGEYQEYGVGVGRHEEKYPKGRISFPTIGEQDKIYVDQLTGFKYIWNSKIGNQIFQLPNFQYKPGTNLINVITPLKIGSGISYWLNFEAEDEKGQYRTIEFQWGSEYHPGVYTDRRMQVSFIDPTTTPMPTTVPYPKNIYPTFAYYDPDNPKAIDLGQLPIAFGDVFTIFLPKTYDLMHWNSSQLLAMVQSGVYNYSFFQSSKHKGSYVRIS